MKSIFAIAAIIIVLALFVFFYLNQALQSPAPETPLLPGIGVFHGPPARPTSTYVSPTFYPPVFVGPFAEPKIVGPQTNPPAPATTTGQ